MPVFTHYAPNKTSLDYNKDELTGPIGLSTQSTLIDDIAVCCIYEDGNDHNDGNQHYDDNRNKDKYCCHKLAYAEYAEPTEPHQTSISRAMCLGPLKTSR